MDLSASPLRTHSRITNALVHVCPQASDESAASNFDWLVTASVQAEASGPGRDRITSGDGWNEYMLACQSVRRLRLTMQQPTGLFLRVHEVQVWHPSSLTQAELLHVSLASLLLHLISFCGGCYRNFCRLWSPATCFASLAVKMPEYATKAPATVQLAMLV
eukprot:SAG31_NODE_10091_length_1185_cov_0.881215_1_plen_161_part_00